MERPAKECTVCGETKTLDGFYVHSYRTDGTPVHFNYCKCCRRSQARGWHTANREQQRKNVRARYHAIGRYDRYGITKKIYDATLVAQNGCCALCGADKPGGNGKWCIDHSHDLGVNSATRRSVFKQSDADQFRGILCQHCNVAIGFHEILTHKVGAEKIEQYLRRTPARLRVIK